MSKSTTHYCVLHDSSGKIIHIHSEMFPEGMKPHPDEEIEKLARKHAQAAKREVSKAKAAHFRNHRFPSWPRQIDSRTGELIFVTPDLLKKAR
jgi:hypothetical protein